jgi:hypothetical protein
MSLGARMYLACCGLAFLHLAQPEMVEGQTVQVGTEFAEAVHVTVADGAPVDELDAQLERALGGAHELCFVDTEDGIEGGQMRNAGLADSDNADVVGFDQPDAVVALEDARHGRGGHPARGAAADDHDIPDVLVLHLRL